MPSRPIGLRPEPPQIVMWPLVNAEERPETTGSGHVHWGITAFMSLEGDTFRDSVTIEVEAASEQEAVARAQELIERRHYRVSWVREVCSKDEALRS